MEEFGGIISNQPDFSLNIVRHRIQNNWFSNIWCIIPTLDIKNECNHLDNFSTHKCLIVPNTSAEKISVSIEDFLSKLTANEISQNKRSLTFCKIAWFFRKSPVLKCIFMILTFSIICVEDIIIIIKTDNCFDSRREIDWYGRYISRENIQKY